MGDQISKKKGKFFQSNWASFFFLGGEINFGFLRLFLLVYFLLTFFFSLFYFLTPPTFHWYQILGVKPLKFLEKK